MKRPGLIRAAAVTALALAAALAAAPAAFAADRPLKPSDVTDEIICPCDCGEVLTGCICDLGKEMKGVVEQSLKEGKTREQITAAFVAKYGEVVRGAPKAKGFNLIVWVAPFLATVVGLVIAGLVLRRWTARRQALQAAGAADPAAGVPGGAASPVETDLETLRARAEDEIRRLQKGDGR